MNVKGGGEHHWLEVPLTLLQGLGDIQSAPGDVAVYEPGVTLGAGGAIGEALGGGGADGPFEGIELMAPKEGSFEDCAL